MKLSFDLDGVIADTDNGLLGLLHQAVRDEKPGATHALEQYYARRRVVLDPRDFLFPGDCFHIISGRVPIAHYITERWVERWFGSSALDRLHLLGDYEVEELFAQGHDESASALLAELKLQTIRYVGIGIHYDNNPAIVRRLRQACVAAVMVGGGLR